MTCDLFGPLLCSAGGGRYTAFYSCLKSRFVYVKVLRHKTDHYTAFVEVIVDVKARSGHAMRFFKTDGDGIFTGAEALALYEKYCIRHTQSAPGDSASNDIAERTIRTFAELTRTNLAHAGAPSYMWAEAMGMVEYVWNHIAVCPNPLVRGSFLSRTSILEGHNRKYDLSILRAFGTKCHFMLTLQKKGGRKEAVGPKAQLGVIVGIEDNMPAYRVFDFEQRGKMRKIPFAQVVSHEGHYPFKDWSRWTDEEKNLPQSFVPSIEAHEDGSEWKRFRFSEEEEKELDLGLSLPDTAVVPISSSMPEELGAFPPSGRTGI
jgi:hypothetical protein